MKYINNWRLGTVFDIEANGLLDKASVFHVLSFQMADGRSGSIEGTDHARFKKFLQYHIDNKIPVVGHYMVLFDVPLCEKLLDIDLTDLMVIDTVALSWYLNTKRELHGLDSFHEDYGIAKPKIDNWDDLTYEEYKFRCEEDVKINVALWQDFMLRLEEIYTVTKHCIDSGKVNPKRLSSAEVVYLDRYVNNSSVDEYVERILTFLMFKMDCARLQEKTRWKADVENIARVHKELSVIIEEAKEDLESIMPPIPKYGSRKKPIEPYKKDGTIKVATAKWNQAIENIGKVDEYGNNLTNFTESENEVSVINKYEKPNANSPDQLKKLFYSHGWVPETFKYVKDPEAMELWVKGGFRKEDKPIPRKIPQINIDGDDGKELCPSILRLTESEPKILKYDKYTMVKHRLDTIKGFLRDLSEDGYLKARIGGFTNTLRIRHRELVNLVGVDKPYGEDLRGSLTCLEGEVLLGSDLSSLEDRTKHHFMLPHDPDYVATMMAEDYDPHILTAHSAGMVSDAELQGFKLKTLVGDIKEAVAKARKGGKTTNYASVYGGSPEAIARGGGIDLSLAKQLHEGYWKLNWSVKAIGEEQCVFEDSRKQKWLINPINGFCYSLRTEKDRFSTLAQGTGSFFFDIWVDNILTEMERVFKVKKLTGCFHDEYIVAFKDSPKARSMMEKITLDAIDKVNTTFLLRRNLGCDVQFGQKYSSIH
ncbi:DNA pol I [Shewanella sp. phage 1/4]|uniref:DNA pol I n=1 Tax=Shewanella phage 1/4 TaxID=1458859 RepID=UPI0004F824AC|nr:DNA pol I [Shewanella sp. phage 1/4]AHK11296.1 DNA pol I [Shewanella sp. phage 1/4]